MKIFNSILKDRYDLTTNKSLKKTKHIILELKEKIDFKPGDSIGVYPTSDPELANKIVKILKEIPKEINALSAEEFLIKNIDLEHLNKNIISFVISKQRDNSKKIMIDYFLKNDKIDLLKKFIKDHDLLSFLEQNNNVNITFEEFTKHAMPIMPRLYSIASSPKKNEKQIDLTVGIVEYETSIGKRIGIGSKFFSNIPIGSEIKCYLQPNPSFRIPEDHKNIIMIGAGTGIAPFRAFMQERELNNCSGKNWLFFGEQTIKNDFYYQDELQSWISKNILKLDVAFSRDNKEKNYVQDLILKNKKEFLKWIENGAHIYICGAREMGKDVDATIYNIIKELKAFSDEQTAEHIKNLKNEKRYLKDVY